MNSKERGAKFELIVKNILLMIIFGFCKNFHHNIKVIDNEKLYEHFTQYYRDLLTHIKENGNKGKEISKKYWQTYIILKKMIEKTSKITHSEIIKTIATIEVPEIRKEFCGCLLDITDNGIDFNRLMVFIEDPENIKMFHENDYNVNFLLGPNGITPLMQACADQNIKLIEELLNPIYPIDINQNDINENTALSFAIHSKNIDVFRKILNHKDIDLNSYNKTRNTYMMEVIVTNREKEAIIMCNMIVNKIKEQLKTYFITIENQEGDTPLSLALSRNYYKLAEYLIAKGAEVDYLNFKGLTAYTLAFIENNQKHIDFLKQHKANINATDQSNNTVLMYQVLLEKPKNVEILLNNGADPDLTNKDGFTVRNLIDYCSNKTLRKKIKKIFKNYDRQKEILNKEKNLEIKESPDLKLETDEKNASANIPESESVAKSPQVLTNSSNEFSDLYQKNLFESSQNPVQDSIRKNMIFKRRNRLILNGNFQDKKNKTNTEAKSNKSANPGLMTSQVVGGARPKIKNKDCSFQPQMKQKEHSLQKIKKQEEMALIERTNRQKEIFLKQEQEKLEAQKRQLKIEEADFKKTNLIEVENTKEQIELTNQQRDAIAKKIDPKIYLIKRNENLDHDGRPGILITEHDNKLLVAVATSDMTWNKKDEVFKEQYKPLEITLDENKKSYFNEVVWIKKDEIKKRWNTNVNLSESEKKVVSKLVPLKDLEKLVKSKDQILSEKLYKIKDEKEN